jgi:hypothetical protein
MRVVYLAEELLYEGEVDEVLHEPQQVLRQQTRDRVA